MNKLIAVRIKFHFFALKRFVEFVSESNAAVSLLGLHG